MTKYILMILMSYLVITISEIIFIIFKKYSTVQNNISERSQNHLNTISQENSFFYNLELSIIYRSGIRRLIPFLTITQFLIFNSVVGLITFVILYSKIHLFIPCLVITSITVLIPVNILNIMEQKRSELVSKELTRFISVISRWSMVKDDIFYCFEKALSQISDPLKGYIQKFLLNVKYTGDISYAFDILLLQSNNELYKNFVINIRQSEQSKGDLPMLLDHLEDEVYKIEAENSRRKSVTLRDRMVIYVTMVCVLLIGGLILALNEKICKFYIDTTVGKYLLTFYSILYFFGIYITSKITSFDY